MRSEFAFLSFCWDLGIQVIPRPLACDNHNRVALYEFIQGEKIKADEISESHILQFLGFYSKINRLKVSQRAYQLPDASEACFSINDHLACIDNRIERLKKIPATNPIDTEAIEFIQASLLPLWLHTKNNAHRYISTHNINPSETIDPVDRCLSPSDFGFHNALKQGEMLRFIDFEYAGWDDSAKMICDFFCQPEIPVPVRYVDMFLESVASGLSKPSDLHRRVRVLFPAYRIKWVCIMLNVFHPVDHLRFNFALQGMDLGKKKRLQLEKACRAIKCCQ